MNTKLVTTVLLSSWTILVCALLYTGFKLGYVAGTSAAELKHAAEFSSKKQEVWNAGYDVGRRSTRADVNEALENWYNKKFYESNNQL